MELSRSDWNIIGWSSLFQAFSVLRSDSGEWREAREQGKNKEEERTRLLRFSPPAPPSSCFSCTLLLRAVFAIWTLGTGSLDVQSLKGALIAKRISAIHSASEKTPAKILSHAYLKCIMFGNLSNCNLQRLADMILRAIQTQNKAWPADPSDGIIREKSLRFCSDFHLRYPLTACCCYVPGYTRLLRQLYFKAREYL